VATSGTYDFNPGIHEHVAEACERVGLRPENITGEHVRSIKRSIGLILASWSNTGPRLWTFQQTLNATSAGGSSFTLPQGTIDTTSVVLRRGGRDTEMYPISRDDYLMIPDKTTTGRPDRYWLDRRRDDAVGTRVLFTYWPSGENATDLIVVNTYRQIQDGGAIANTLDIPFRFQEAFDSALAARIAQKFKPERFGEAVALAETAWADARAADEGSGDLVLSVQYGRHGRR
jgi:hypothetical protein